MNDGWGILYGNGERDQHLGTRSTQGDGFEMYLVRLNSTARATSRTQILVSAASSEVRIDDAIGAAVLKSMQVA